MKCGCGSTMAPTTVYGLKFWECHDCGYTKGGEAVTLITENRNLYNAVTDWLQASAYRMYDTDEEALEDMLEMIGDWSHQWIQDVKEARV